MGIYFKFSEYYDSLMSDVDYESWYKFLRKISKRPFENVLELACGTGNLTQYIAKDKNIKTITGVDISEDMLSKASQKLVGFSNINLYRQDIKYLNMGKKRYDTVICACDGLNYIIDDREIKNVFKKIYNLITEKGQFIFDLNSYYKLKEIIGDNIFIDETEEIFCIWENAFDHKSEIAEFYLTFFNKVEDEKYERFEEIHYERAYKKDRIVEYLREAGFDSIELYYDFNHEEDISIVENNYERIFFVCNK